MKYKNTKFKHSPLAFFKTKPDGTIVVVHSEAVDFSVVNLEESSAQLWLQMVAPKSYEELAQWMCAEYEVEQKTAEEDLEQFLDELLEKQLLESSKA